jgi:hypothetical protein
MPLADFETEDLRCGEPDVAIFQATERSVH